MVCHCYTVDLYMHHTTTHHFFIHDVPTLLPSREIRGPRDEELLFPYGASRKRERYIDVRLMKSVCKCYAHEHDSARRGMYLQFSDEYLSR